MAKSKSTNKARSIFSTANKYQDKIILLTFIPSALVFVSFLSIVFIGNPVLSKGIIHVSFPNMEKYVAESSELIVFLLCAVFFLSMLVAFYISHNMVGAFGRINKELDEIIAGKSQKTITCRPYDDLPNQFLKRINVLVKYYVEHKNKES